MVPVPPTCVLMVGIAGIAVRIISGFAHYPRSFSAGGLHAKQHRRPSMAAAGPAGPHRVRNQPTRNPELIIEPVPAHRGDPWGPWE